MKIDVILVPTDFSKHAEQALETATELARTFGSRIVLLHAYSLDLPLASPALGGGVILPEGFYVEYRSQASLEVERRARQATRSDVEVEGIAIERPAWSAILDQAEVLPADLIVMGTRGLTGIKHVALGSTAERVVRMAPCPVLTVKAD
jgi:nucleotide-binding universal stress UspA family protein